MHDIYLLGSLAGIKQMKLMTKMALLWEAFSHIHNVFRIIIRTKGLAFRRLCQKYAAQFVPRAGWEWIYFGWNPNFYCQDYAESLDNATQLEKKKGKTFFSRLEPLKTRNKIMIYRSVSLWWFNRKHCLSFVGFNVSPTHKSPISCLWPSGLVLLTSALNRKEGNSRIDAECIKFYPL